ncbi:MAG: lysophospholipid acyltransferase family protein [Chakrabartia sp.]
MIARLIALVRSLVFAFVFYVGSVPVVAFAWALVAFGERSTIFGARLWAKWHRLCARFILGIRTEVLGTLDDRQALYIFKHESMYETVETLALFRRPVVVMKQELLDLFGWGHAARAHGSIGVNREAGAAAMRRMIAEAKRAKDSGRPIILFPEGTRVPHGERPALRAGLAGLYKILGLPVIPVALNSGKVWPRGFIKYPGVVTMKVGDEIPAGLPREELEARVHAAINALND